MINDPMVNANNFKLAQEIIKLHGGVMLIQRSELAAAHLKLRKRKCSPHFIAKNKACKTKTVGLYNLAVLKLEKIAKVAPAVKTAPVTPAAAKKAVHAAVAAIVASKKASKSVAKK